MVVLIVFYQLFLRQTSFKTYFILKVLESGGWVLVALWEQLLKPFKQCVNKLLILNKSISVSNTMSYSLQITHARTHARISSVSSTEKDIDTRLTKAWTANDRLSILWKSDLTDKMKHSFFQAAVVSILLYGCTTLTLTKPLKKKLDGNYTRMLRAILNKSWRQHPTKH